MTFYRHHERVTTSTPGPSRTKQSHKDECDIHRILKQYSRTGILEHVNRSQPMFENLPDPEDYQTSLHRIMLAQDSFAALPSSVREHFGNDPARFLSAFSDQRQHDYLREVGLLKPVAPPLNPASDQSSS